MPHVWSVHIRDKECALCFTNGKGATKKAALASALGEYFERLSTNYFFADFWLGDTIANGPFVHYPNEKWFPLTEDDEVPEGLLDARLRAFYDPDDQLTASMLVDLQSGNDERGVCGLPFTRQSDGETVYIPMNIVGNLYVSNGMSAGNTRNEARVQGLSEVFERHIKNRIIAESISLPEIPAEVMARYPGVVESIAKLEAEGFPIFAYDGSLGGKYPVICVVLFNPANGTCFASFGAHPDFGVALERTVTELLQGRSLKDLDVFTPPTFDDEEVAEHANLETHFIDSSGLISWDMFKQDADYPFVDWSFSGTTEEEFATLMAIFKAEDKEDYLALIEQMDDEGLDDFTRVRELLGLATGKDNGWYTLRVGELKAMLALAGGDLEQALIWTEWTMEFNASVFSAERANYYRCLQTLLLLSQEEERQPLQYLNAFIRMYGAEAVEAASAALSGEAPFYGLQAVDSDLQAFPAHQSLLKAYEKLQRAKAAFWAK